MKQNKNEYWKETIDYVCITLGALLASFSVACVLLPNDAVDYGTAGIAIIISKLSGLNLSLCVAIVFLPFIIMGGIILGRKFFLKAAVGSVFYTAGLALFEDISIALNTEHFIAVAFGGALLGFGLSLILRFGGCIDGSEILANIIVEKIAEKTGKNYSLTGILVGFNACVYIAVFVLIDRNSALLSLLVYVVATVVIDHTTDHFDSIKEVTIITQHPEKLILRIKDEMKKTCTVMNSYGAIAGENKTVIYYVTYFELQKLKDIVAEFEGNCFVTVATVDEIFHPKKVA